MKDLAPGYYMVELIMGRGLAVSRWDGQVWRTPDAAAVRDARIKRPVSRLVEAPL